MSDLGRRLDPAPVQADEFNWKRSAESITVRIRWFGLCVGYVLVNFSGRETNQPALNAILTLGAVYAVIDTWWSVRGRAFLRDAPLIISLMEAVFIGLLCHFDVGVDSPFRFYYFLSLLVAAVRHSPPITYCTLALHTGSFCALVVSHEIPFGPELTLLLLTIVLMAWVTWAGTALVELVKGASYRLSELNDELQQNQSLLEQRISERTQELQESQALLVQQEKQAAFGLLAAGIAHEVGNPLAAISSLVQLLNRRHDDPYTRERLEMVDGQLRRIQRTLRELVDFSRPATTELSRTDIHDAINESLNIAKYYKRKKGKTIRTRFADGLPLIRVARDQVVQVFLNLILNAMDATDEGGAIEINTCLRAGWIEVAIHDEGHGVAESDRTRIFEPYFTTKETGTGLGLFVCRQILQGVTESRLELTRTSERGSTFSVFLTCDTVRGHADVLTAEVAECVTLGSEPIQNPVEC
ncbi:MAG: ATP-binding protein [Planctomycetota bacterium]|nr:ATP-binding protein [Planctomycetota bacterium]